MGATGVCPEGSYSLLFLLGLCSCILSQSGQNFATYFWKYTKDLFVKPLTSDWSAQHSENSHGIQSLFCAKHELPTEENYTALTETALQLPVLDGISNVY